MHIPSFLEALQPLVREAGNRIMAVYAMDLQGNSKADGSPVTLADQVAESVILEGLQHIAPTITVVSEENAASHCLAASSQFILVDPLDGTKEFLKRDGKGAFTVNIALIRDAVPIAGIVYAPALDRLFTGALGYGAHEECAGIKLAIQARAPTLGRVLAVASESHRDAQTNAWLAQHHIAHITSIGSSLKFCLLAAGEADVYPRFSPTMEWDTAAGDAVLRGAGGLVTFTTGEAYTYGKANYKNVPFVAYGMPANPVIAAPQ
jgi:3'(2'), 5'-bisphosphate nucleotidase